MKRITTLSAFLVCFSIACNAQDKQGGFAAKSKAEVNDNSQSSSAPKSFRTKEASNNHSFGTKSDRPDINSTKVTDRPSETQFDSFGTKKSNRKPN